MEDFEVSNEIEFNVINELFTNTKYFNVVFPYVRSEIFNNLDYRLFFQKLKEYFDKYNSIPSVDDLKFYCLNNYKDDKALLDTVSSILSKLSPNDNINREAFLKETEKFILRENFMIEVNSAIDSISNKKFEVDKAIVSMNNVLNVKFDSDLGIDYVKDSVEYFDKYKRTDETFIKSSLSKVNECVGGGFLRQASYVFIGRTNIGKTLIMCSIASDLYLQGYNVLYVTAEMQKDRIRQRVDANILNVPIRDLSVVSTEELSFKLKEKLKNSKVTDNRLIIKDYVPDTATANTVKSLLVQLKIQENFVPDVVVLDYMTKFKSYTYNKGNIQEHTYIKAVADEFQSFAVANDVSLITAMQLNRMGAAQSDIKMTDMTNISGSWDSVAGLDFVGILFQNTDQRLECLIQIKVNKTRSADNNEAVYDFNIDYRHMRLLNDGNDLYGLEINLAEPKVENKTSNEKIKENIETDELGDYILTESKFGIEKKYINNLPKVNLNENNVEKKLPEVEKKSIKDDIYLLDNNEI